MGNEQEKPDNTEQYRIYMDEVHETADTSIYDAEGDEGNMKAIEDMAARLHIPLEELLKGGM